MFIVVVTFRPDRSVSWTNTVTFKTLPLVGDNKPMQNTTQVSLSTLDDYSEKQDSGTRLFWSFSTESRPVFV